MSSKILFILILAITVSPVLATAGHSAIHILEQQIEVLQKQLADIRAKQPAAATPGQFSSTLRRGSRGPEVKRLQEFLAQTPEFYPERLITGAFGPATERAIRRFQKTYGISPTGAVGPQTRVKLNELMAEEKPAPQAAVPTLPPTTEAAPSPTPQPAPSPQPVPAPVPVNVPTADELGQPFISSVAWGEDHIKIVFTHDPSTFTRSYTVLQKKPGEAADAAIGTHAVLAVGGTSDEKNGISFRRIGQNAWEWRRAISFGALPAGNYIFAVRSNGDGGAVGNTSPGRIAPLYAKAEFEGLLEGSPLQSVQNNVVTRFPLTMRISNFVTDLYYHYEIWDGQTRVWDSSYLTNAASSKIEAVFHNTNGYQFASGKTYRISVSIFDNNTGAASVTKQQPGGLIFTYRP